MNIKFMLRSQFDLLIKELELLTNEIKNADLIEAKYFQLPNISKNDESEIPEHIKVEKYTGNQAVEKICNAYLDLYIGDKESGKVMQRHPGLLLINDTNQTLLNRLQNVNREKQKFKDTVLQIENNDARFEAVHSAIPNLITLNAYKKIHFENDNPFSIRFSWMKKHAVKTMNKKSAMQMLERSSNYSNPRMIDQQTWLRVVEQEKIRVASLSNKAKLRIRRPIRVTPEVNVRFTAQHRYHVSGALPFIMLNPPKDLKVGELSSYKEKEDDPRKKEYNFIVDRLYLEKT